MENEIVNRIIAISGEPVTGKGTTVKALRKKLIDQGYEDENIHIVSTGEKFREYFNTVVDLTKVLASKFSMSKVGKPTEELDEKIEELKNTEILKIIMQNEQYKETFLKSVTQLIENNVDLEGFSIEDANNLQQLDEVRAIIDQTIDSEIAQMGENINQKVREDEIWIVDSRLAFHNIPKAFSVRLISTPDVAAQRLLADSSRGKEDNKYANEEQAKEAREKRRIGEKNRYLKRYGVNLENEENYNLIIDTSFSKTDEIVQTILDCEELYRNGEKYAQKWTSPIMLLPTQELDEAYSMNNSRAEEIKESINKDGFKRQKPINVIKSGRFNFVYDGHHRKKAAIDLGKTLVPYKIMAKDDENFYESSTREYIYRIISIPNYTSSILKEYEKDDKNRYAKVYAIKNAQGEYDSNLLVEQVINELKNTKTREEDNER